jgi:hypothetical protein
MAHSHTVHVGDGIGWTGLEPPDPDAQLAQSDPADHGV